MILQSLVALAERDGLLGDTTFEPKSVPWIVEILPNNDFFIVETDSIKLIPRRRKGKDGNTIVPDCLVDKQEYLFGIADSDQSRNRAIQRMNAMLQEIQQISEETQDPGVQQQLMILRSFKENPTRLEHAFRNVIGARIATPVLENCLIQLPSSFVKQQRKSQLIAFRFDGQLVCQRPLVKEWIRKNLISKDLVMGNCLVTGKWSPITRIHPKINFPGDKGTFPFISFDGDAFQHYGFSQGENASIAEDQADAIALAIKRLADPKFPNPKTGEPFTKRMLSLTDKTTLLFWSESSPNSVDPLDSLLLSDCFSLNATVIEREPQVRAIYDAYRSGRPPCANDLTPFRSLILTREKSRVVLRTAILSTIKEVSSSVARYFQDLNIVAQSHEKSWYPSLNFLLRATVSDGVKPTERRKHVTPDLATSLMLCALEGRPFPPLLLETCLRRIRSQGKVTTARMAIIKASVLSWYRLNPHQTPSFPKEFLVDIERDHPEPAYHLGRLFAVMEVIQQKANRAKAGIADRFLGKAVSAPAQVFAQLMVLKEHHLSKIGGGLATNAKILFDEIILHIPPKIPATLSLVEQGTFMIGYHHQRCHVWDDLKTAPEETNDDSTTTNPEE